MSTESKHPKDDEHIDVQGDRDVRDADGHYTIAVFEVALGAETASQTTSVPARVLLSARRMTASVQRASRDGVSSPGR